MTTNNILEFSKLEIECEGTGETIEKAIESAFSDMRRKLVEKVKFPIITIKTEEVYLIDKKTNSKTEAFLFFFAKRENLEEYLKLKVVVTISYLKINK